MKTFKQFLTEAAPNLHMEHLEDEIFNGGVDGTRGAINFLRSLRDMLSGHVGKHIDVSVKWDGAPAVYAGYLPGTTTFFVATKGLFNKEPKYATTPQEVDQLFHQGLAPKLKLALKHFSKLGIKGIIQGDLMFTHSDLVTQKIDGEEFITFQPNTIVYAVPTKSKLAKTINKAKIGVVWHTAYSGDSLDNLKASFNADVSYMKKSSDVWFQDAKFEDVSGSASFTSKETAQVTSLLSQAGKTFNQVDPKLLNTLMTDSEIHNFIKIYNNSKVRAGEHIKSPKKHVDGFEVFLKQRIEKNVESVKQEKTKEKKREQGQRWLDFVKKNKRQLVLIFTLFNHIVDSKILIVRKLESVKQTHMFVRTADGYQVTSPEGFVGIDHMGNAVKLVDRMTFSKNNFNVVKNWDK